MNNGKYARQPRRRRRSNRKKASFLLTSLVLLLTLFIGGTTAFLIASGPDVTNTFQPSTVTCRVDEETFDGNVKQNVTIANTGDTTAYIRATYVVTWKNSDGQIYPAAPVAGVDFTIETDPDWVLGAGGYYYFRYPVPKNNSTGTFIAQCAPIEGKTPEGYALNVEILGSAIQSVPINVVHDNWGVTVANDGTIS